MFIDFRIPDNYSDDMQRGLYGGAKESEVIHEQLYISREAVV
jgi:hypothetical protein